MTDSREPDAYLLLGDALLTGALNQALAMVLSLASVAKDNEVKKEALDIVNQAVHVPGFANWDVVGRWADEFDRRAQHEQG